MKFNTLEEKYLLTFNKQDQVGGPYENRYFLISLEVGTCDLTSFQKAESSHLKKKPLQKDVMKWGFEGTLHSLLFL